MNSLTQLTKACETIEMEINHLKSGNPDIEPISDGIINIEKYINSKYKILWVLKESNDLVDGKGGGWSLTTAISALTSWYDQKQTGGITFKRMIYASYGILNNFTLWKEMPSVTNDEVFDVIKCIAYINIKKIPGGVSSNESMISKAYQENQQLLLKQIKTYDPDIIIAGNTLQHFFNDLPINFNNKRYVDEATRNTAYYPDENKLYIHSWHPAVRPQKISEETYCNEIIMAAKEWADNFKVWQ
jgi:hypothetical protein